MATAWMLLKWWFWMAVIGWLAFPLTWRWLHVLPDRGVTLTRSVGLLLWGYVLWLGATLGVLPNTFGGALGALLIVTAVAAWMGRNGLRRNERGERPLWRWLQAHWPAILVAETVFLLAFLAWAYVRAQSPDIATAGGEKFMEITFINGVLASRQFPPQDPWLAGYAISYYYFGYVLIGGLITLAQVPASVGFNIGFASWFALTFVAALGLIGGWVLRTREESWRTHLGRWVRWGGAGAGVVTLMGNWEGFLEVLYARRLLPVGFWQWLDIRSINVPYDPAQPPSWVPQRFIWWWQASRVIHDRDLQGNTMEVIDEFPAFSFILGDMHPHVLVLPFVLLTIGLALTLFYTAQDHAAGRYHLTLGRWQIRWPFSWGLTLLYSLVLGGLAFLNTWDFPIYWTLIVGVLAVRRVATNERSPLIALGEALREGLVLAVLGFVLYMPFYLGFQSQASGLLPNLFNPTRWPQFLVMFGPLLGLLALLWLTLGRGVHPGRFGRWLVAVWAIPWVIVGLLVLMYTFLPPGREFLQQVLSHPVVQQNVAGRSVPELLWFVLRRRVQNPWTFLALGALLAWSLAHLWSRLTAEEGSEEGRTLSHEVFALLLVVLGLLLTYAVEFVYIKDLFGTRMNTVFKFYYQAWMLWSVAGVWALARWWHTQMGFVRSAGMVLAGLALALGLVYTVLAIPARSQLGMVGPTLDGEAWVAQTYPEDYAIIQWVRANTRPSDVVLEATGGSYTFFGRVAAFTGRPTLFGWDFHELQWRGAALQRQAGTRAADIERIYTQAQGDTLLALLRRYNVAYLVVGTMERQKYGISPARQGVFDRVLEKVWEQGDSAIYRVP